MDTLTFGSPILLRHLTFSEAKKMPISEISLRKSLDGLGFSMDEVRLSVFYYYYPGILLPFARILLTDSSIFRSCFSSLIYVFFWDAITATRSRILDLLERSR